MKKLNKSRNIWHCINLSPVNNRTTEEELPTIYQNTKFKNKTTYEKLFTPKKQFLVKLVSLSIVCKLRLKT